MVNIFIMYFNYIKQYVTIHAYYGGQSYVFYGSHAVTLTHYTHTNYNKQEV